MKLSIDTASVTDIGLNTRKAVNEDSLLVLPEAGIFAVADGVGGTEAGAVASQLAVETLAAMSQAAGPAMTDAVAHIRELVATANEEIYQAAAEKQSTMASTLALVFLQDDYALLAHVGDSRIYLFRDGKVLQLTTDHSKLQTLLDNLPPDTIDAEHFDESHVITRALGVEESVEPDIQKVMLKDEDIFVLCTDGVYKYNSEDELRTNVARNSSDLPKICETLKEQCYAGGAKDHLTAVVLRVTVDNPDLQKTRMLTTPPSDVSSNPR